MCNVRRDSDKASRALHLQEEVNKLKSRVIYLENRIAQLDAVEVLAAPNK